MTTLQVSKQNSRTVAGMAGVGRTRFRSVLPVLLAFLLIVGGLRRQVWRRAHPREQCQARSSTCQRCSSER